MYSRELTYGHTFNNPFGKPGVSYTAGQTFNNPSVQAPAPIPGLFPGQPYGPQQIVPPAGQQYYQQPTPPFGQPTVLPPVQPPGQQFAPPIGQPVPPLQPGPVGPGAVPPFGPPQPGAAGQAFGPPTQPPPPFIPQQAQAQGPGVFAVEPGAIRPCLYRFVYIWLTTGQQFWAWLVFAGANSVAGWRWTGNRWVYFGIDTTYIAGFTCY